MYPRICCSCLCQRGRGGGSLPFVALAVQVWPHQIYHRCWAFQLSLATELLRSDGKISEYFTHTVFALATLDMKCFFPKRSTLPHRLAYICMLHAVFQGEVCTAYRGKYIDIDVACLFRSQRPAWTKNLQYSISHPTPTASPNSYGWSRCFETTQAWEAE